MGNIRQILLNRVFSLTWSRVHSSLLPSTEQNSLSLCSCLRNEHWSLLSCRSTHYLVFFSEATFEQSQAREQLLRVKHLLFLHIFIINPLESLPLSLSHCREGGRREMAYLGFNSGQSDRKWSGPYLLLIFMLESRQICSWLGCANHSISVSG